MNDWVRAEHHAEKADRLLQAGRCVQALREWRQAVAMNPYQGRWQLYLGRTLETLGRYREALNAYERACELLGEDVESMLCLAVGWIREGRPRRALQQLRRIHELDPGYEPAYCHEIAAHVRLGDHHSAEVAFYLARQLVERCPTCYDHIARSHALRGNLQQAVRCWEQAMCLKPRAGGIAANLARSYWQLGRRNTALAMFEHHLRAQPFDAESMLQCACLLLELGKHASARRLLEHVSELDPACAEAHLHLGEIALSAGKPETAAYELQHAARLDPRLPMVRLRLAQLSLKRGLRDDAVRQLEVELDQPPIRRAAQVLDLGATLVACGLVEPAALVLTELIDRPDSHDLSREVLAAARLYRSQAWLSLGRHRPAIRDCRAALRVDPLFVPAMRQLAAAHFQLRQLRRAGYWLDRARLHQPEDSRLRRLRRRLRRRVWGRRLYHAVCMLTAPLSGGRSV